MSKTKKQDVRVTAELELTLDLTAVLDGWSDDEVREFIEGDDDEGREILKREGTRSRDSYMHIDRGELLAYAKARGIDALDV